ncbi:MAG: type II toxin-antitoxin system RelE/ParE family toxin [Kofleriaceae bacterium]
MSYVVRLEHVAVLQIERIASWWKLHRLESPDLFETELIALLSSLATLPYRGTPVPRSRPRSTRRRLLIPHTTYRITYNVVDTTREVVVTRVASSRRR